MAGRSRQYASQLERTLARSLRVTDSASGVNFLELEPAAAAASPALRAVGSDTHLDVLLEPKGAGLARVGGYPVPSSAARRLFWHHDLGSTTGVYSQGGTPATLTQLGTTPVVSGLEAADGSFEGQQTHNATDSDAGRMSSVPVAFRALSPRLTMGLRAATAITSMRVFFGYTTANLLALTADPTTEHAAIFRYDVGLDTTGLVSTITCDGSSPTVTLGAAAITAATALILSLELDEARGVCRFYSNGVQCAEHSTHLPGQTTPLYLFAGVRTLHATQRRQFYWSHFVQESR